MGSNHLPSAPHVFTPSQPFRTESFQSLAAHVASLAGGSNVLVEGQDATGIVEALEGMGVTAGSHPAQLPSTCAIRIWQQIPESFLSHAGQASMLFLAAPDGIAGLRLEQLARLGFWLDPGFDPAGTLAGWILLRKAAPSPQWGAMVAASYALNRQERARLEARNGELDRQLTRCQGQLDAFEADLQASAPWAEAQVDTATAREQRKTLERMRQELLSEHSRLIALEGQVEELSQNVSSILQSRIWQTLVKASGLLLRVLPGR